MQKQNTYIDKPVVIVAAVKVKAMTQKPCHGEIKLSRTSTPKALSTGKQQHDIRARGPGFCPALGQEGKTALSEKQGAHT